MTKLNDWKNTPSRGKNLTERVYWILTAYQNFDAMGCNAFERTLNNWENWGSFEDIHNSVHYYVGGHMASIPVSAFDPVFWLHHK
jgi:tyrosinase